MPTPARSAGLPFDVAASAQRALVGEVMTRWAHARGIAGFVVDGAVRDLDYLRQGPLPRAWITQTLGAGIEG